MEINLRMIGENKRKQEKKGEKGNVLKNSKTLFRVKLIKKD